MSDAIDPPPMTKKTSRVRRSTASSSSEATAGSKLPNEILALGDQIVRELEADGPLDTLRRWMAHHLAEQLHQARHVGSPDRQAAEDRAVVLILKIWASRRDAPGRVDPLRRLENVLAVIDRMRSEAWPFRDYRDDETVQLLTEAFDGLRMLVCAGVVLTQWGDHEPVDAGAATGHLDGEEKAVIDRLNEWMAFVEKIPSRRPTVRIVTSDEEAAAVEAEDNREAEIEAMPERKRTLKRVDDQLEKLIEKLQSLRTALAKGAA